MKLEGMIKSIFSFLCGVLISLIFFLLSGCRIEIVKDPTDIFLTPTPEPTIIIPNSPTPTATTTPIPTSTPVPGNLWFPKGKIQFTFNGVKEVEKHLITDVEDDLVIAVLTQEKRVEERDLSVPIVGIHLRKNSSQGEKLGFVFRLSNNIGYDKETYKENGQVPEDQQCGFGINTHIREDVSDGRWTVMWSDSVFAVLSPSASDLLHSVDVNELVNHLRWTREIGRTSGVIAVKYDSQLKGNISLTTVHLGIPWPRLRARPDRYHLWPQFGVQNLSVALSGAFLEAEAGPRIPCSLATD